MKGIKKIACIVGTVAIGLIIYATPVKATKVKVTTDSLNLREKASTSSDVLIAISENEECEVIGEEEDWYQVKYESYTGYVSKEYVKEVTEKSNDTTTTSSDNKTNQDDSKDAKKDNSVDSTETTGKMIKDTEARLLPLINSTVIETLKKDASITRITEINGWSYIETNTISAWVRTDAIKMDSKSTTTATVTSKPTDTTTKPNDNNDNTKKPTENNNDNNITTSQEKVMYVNDSYVNLREKPSTSSEILMTLEINTKLTVIGEEEGWYKVKTSEGNAYVSKELLSDKETGTTSRGSTVVRGATENIDTKELENPETKKANTNNNVNTSKTTTTTSNDKESSTKGEEVVAYAKQFLGVPYVYGGASKSGFDCSGFTMYVYKKFGINMAHGAQNQAELGQVIKADKSSASSLKNNLKAGDLVFFLDYETMDEIGHCGIYIGNGNFIHASSGSGYCVKINSLLPGEYYNTRYCAARRVL